MSNWRRSVLIYLALYPCFFKLFSTFIFSSSVTSILSHSSEIQSFGIWKINLYLQPFNNWTSYSLFHKQYNSEFLKLMSLKNTLHTFYANCWAVSMQIELGRTRKLNKTTFTELQDCYHMRSSSCDFSSCLVNFIKWMNSCFFCK